MNIYNILNRDLISQAVTNLAVEDAWTFIRSEIVDLPYTGNASDKLTFKIDEQAEGFPQDSNFKRCAGDNSPIENINPEVIPVAVKGDHALFFDVNLNIAEKELEDYEFIYLDDGSTPFYLVWGKLNVSKTDFYTPASEALNAHYFRMADDDSNF